MSRQLNSDLTTHEASQDNILLGDVELKLLTNLWQRRPGVTVLPPFTGV
jgi:hypothetical protein